MRISTDHKEFNIFAETTEDREFLAKVCSSEFKKGHKLSILASVQHYDETVQIAIGWSPDESEAVKP